MSFDVKYCLIAICTLCFHLETQGQVLSDTMRTKDIPQVTVTSDRTNSPGAVSTSKRADARLMQATGTLQVSDVIKYMSGATVKDYGGVGGLKTVSVRGLGAGAYRYLPEPGGFPQRNGSEHDAQRRLVPNHLDR